MESAILLGLIIVLVACGIAIAHHLPRDAGTSHDYRWWARIDTTYADPDLIGRRGEWVRAHPPRPYDWSEDATFGED